MARTAANRTISLGFIDSCKIVLPYFRENLMDQIRNVWFIVAYLVFFQIVILGLPIVFAAMIGCGLLVVAIGLMFFMEGLRLGLMPLGETIGAILPRNSSLVIILLFAFFLGLGATFAEPAIAVLKAAGGGVRPEEAPLLFDLLNRYANQLIYAVGIGVGIAVLLGVLRFFYAWSLKFFLVPLILLLSGLTLWLHSDPVTQPILGLAWDCGAVTTGPVTVPLVLALGIGVCRIVGDGDSGHAGFGIVTLASLFPILAVMLLGIYHYETGDYQLQQPAPLIWQSGSNAVAELPDSQVNSGPTFTRGTTDSRKSASGVLSGGEHTDRELSDREKSQGKPSPIGDRTSTSAGDKAVSGAPVHPHQAFSVAEYRRFIEHGTLPDDIEIRYQGGQYRLEDGRILIDNPVILIEKIQAAESRLVARTLWDPALNLARDVREALFLSMRAIIPLCVFMFITLRLILREKVRDTDGLTVGIIFAVVGMCLFALGISLGLTPLGSQLGSNVPGSFTEITPWQGQSVFGPIFGGLSGKWVAVLFGFFLGYGATLAEPALNALGNSVESITVGAFPKKLLMHSVAFGVGIGIAAGVCKIAFNLPLAWMLVPPYLGLVVLTLISSEEFVNFGWDSAGVTTGPITVPLVLAMGLGVGANIPGVIDGFGVLALASVGPIITVLVVGQIVARYQTERRNPAGIKAVKVGATAND